MRVAAARRPALGAYRVPSRRFRLAKCRRSKSRVHSSLRGRPKPLSKACRSALIQIIVWLAASCLELRPASADTLPRTPEPGSPPPAGALELRVTYRAPRECPSGTEFLAALRAHLAAGGEGSVDADVRISRVGESAFELVLRLRVAAREAESVVRAESCAPLVQLAALNASMARTRAGTEMAGRSPESEPEPALASLPPAGEPCPRPEPKQVAGLDVAAGDPPHPADSPHPLRVVALAEVATASGMLPDTAWGRGFAAGLELGLWSARLAATFWMPRERRFSFDGSSPIVLEFEQESLELSPCVMPSLSPYLRVGGCASFAGHRIHTSAQAPRLVGSLGGSARAALLPWRGLRIEAQAGLSVVPAAPSFDIEALRSVYESKTLQPTAGIALGWEFGAP